MPNHYKDLDDDRHTAVDKQTVSTKSTRHVAMGHQQLTSHGYSLQPHNKNVVHVTENKTKQDLHVKLITYVYMYMSTCMCIYSLTAINMIL